MKRKYQKWMKYIIFTSIFLVLLIGEFVFLYAFESRESASVSVHFTDPISTEPIAYQKKFTVYTPPSYSGRLPAVIMLHGDLVNDKSLNLVKSEFIRNGYMVLLMQLGFTYQSFLEIDAITNYLLIQSNVDHSRIGILGHSHGAHFAFWYAKLRTDVINGIIMANMGTFRQLYEDYYEYYNYFVNTTHDISKGEFLATFSESITEDNPRNLLIITDYYEPIRASQTHNDNLVAWEFLENNKLYGDFHNGTARELNLQYKMFLHGSGLYNPNVIKKHIEWMNNALTISSGNVALLPINLRIYSFFLLMISLIVIASILLYNVIRFIPLQLSWIKNRLYAWKKEKTKNDMLEIPPVLNINFETTRYSKDKYRLEKRFAYEFDYLHDISEYLRIIVIGVIGTHLFLYLIELVFGENVLYFIAGEKISRWLGLVYIMNESLNGVLFTHPLSFQIMYIWILMVFFIRRLRIKDPRINKPKMTLLDLPNIILLGVEIFLIFWFVGFVTLYNWLGLNFLESGLNVVMRFAVILYIHFVIVEFGYNQSSNPDSIDRWVYFKTIFFVFLLYLPITIPSISVFLRVYRYAIYYIIPYIIVTFSLIGFSVFGKKDAFGITIFNFFFLLLWKYNVYYWILF